MIRVRCSEGIIIRLAHTGEIGYFGYSSAAGFVDDLEHDRQAELLGCGDSFIVAFHPAKLRRCHAAVYEGFLHKRLVGEHARGLFAYPA